MSLRIATAQQTLATTGALMGPTVMRRSVDESSTTSPAPTDVVSISEAARRKATAGGSSSGAFRPDEAQGQAFHKDSASDKPGPASGEASDESGEATRLPGEPEGDKKDDGKPSSKLRPTGVQQRLSVEEQKIVNELRVRDREVREHENAHRAAGGALAGAPSYDYATGPDGNSYAVSGEVSISISTGRTPQETLDRARQVRAAALAPKKPSGQDMAVAAMASSMESEAQMAIARQRQKATQKADRSSEESSPKAVDGASGSKVSGAKESVGGSPAPTRLDDQASSNAVSSAGKPAPSSPGAAASTAPTESASESNAVSTRKPRATQEPDYASTTGEAFIGMRSTHMHSTEACVTCSARVRQYIASAA